MILQRRAHRLDVCRAGAAAAADDAHADVAGQARVVGHQLRRAVIADLAVVEIGNPAIALGDHHVAGLRRARHVEQRRQQLGRADPAIGAVGDRAGLERMEHRHRLGRGHPHHGAAVGVEAEGGDDRQAGGGGTGDGGRDLVLRRHGLDPQHVDPAIGQGARLLGEGLGAVRDGERAERLEQLAGRTHGAADHDLAAGLGALGIGDASADPGRSLVHRLHPVLPLVQLEAVPAAAEAVGQHDVRAGLDHGAVQGLDPVGMVEVP